MEQLTTKMYTCEGCQQLQKRTQRSLETQIQQVQLHILSLIYAHNPHTAEKQPIAGPTLSIAIFAFGDYLKNLAKQNSNLANRHF